MPSKKTTSRPKEWVYRGKVDATIRFYSERLNTKKANQTCLFSKNGHKKCRSWINSGRVVDFYVNVDLLDRQIKKSGSSLETLGVIVRMIKECACSTHAAWGKHFNENSLKTSVFMVLDKLDLHTSLVQHISKVLTPDYFVPRSGNDNQNQENAGFDFNAPASTLPALADSTTPRELVQSSGGGGGEPVVPDFSFCFSCNELWAGGIHKATCEFAQGVDFAAFLAELPAGTDPAGDPSQLDANHASADGQAQSETPYGLGVNLPPLPNVGETVDTSVAETSVSESGTQQPFGASQDPRTNASTSEEILDQGEESPGQVQLSRTDATAESGMTNPFVSGPQQPFAGPPNAVEGAVLPQGADAVAPNLYSYSFQDPLAEQTSLSVNVRPVQPANLPLFPNAFNASDLDPISFDDVVSLLQSIGDEVPSLENLTGDETVAGEMADAEPALEESTNMEMPSAGFANDGLPLNESIASETTLVSNDDMTLLESIANQLPMPVNDFPERDMSLEEFTGNEMPLDDDVPLSELLGDEMSWEVSDIYTSGVDSGYSSN